MLRRAYLYCEVYQDHNHFEIELNFKRLIFGYLHFISWFMVSTFKLIKFYCDSNLIGTCCFGLFT